jgi:hypothetical protein
LFVVRILRKKSLGALPAFKVTTHDPLREWRLHLFWFLGSVAAVVAVLIYARLVTAPGFSDLRVERDAARTELSLKAEALKSTNAKLAVAERRAQIADEAGRELRASIAAGLKREARLKADLHFYERLLGGHQRDEGLNAYSLRLEPAGAQGAFKFTLTLAQNRRNVEVVSGEATMALEGSRDGRIETLRWSTLRAGEGDAAMPFSFKYFARLEGQLVVPLDFTPTAVIVRIAPETGAAIERKIDWQSALTAEP